MDSKVGDGSNASSELLSSDSGSSGGSGAASVSAKPKLSNSLEKLPRRIPPSFSPEALGGAAGRSVGLLTSWAPESIKLITELKSQPESGGCEGI